MLYNSGMNEEKKDFKQLHFEKELVKTVVLWDILENNVQKDLEKQWQSLQIKISQLMMLPKIYYLIGKEKEIDGMAISHKCINKSLKNLKILIR